MIVWSRGLGKQRLPLELADAELKVTDEYLAMDGVIEPVCWNYSIKLTTADLSAFLKHLARPETAKFLAERPGLLGPFVLGMIRAAPGLVFRFLATRLSVALGGRKAAPAAIPAKEKKHALLV